MKLSAFIIMLLFALPAQAQEKALCTFLANGAHLSGADYVAGVDVHGKPVVSADLNDTMAASAPPGVFQPVRFPVTIDVAENMGLDMPEGTELPASFGLIEIDGANVRWNGQDISQKAYAFCALPVPEDKDEGDEKVIEQQNAEMVTPVIEDVPEAAPETVEAPIVQEPIVQEPVNKEQDIIWGAGY